MTEAIQRAQRLRMARAMTGLSRDRIQKRYGLAKSTLQNWENAANGGLTYKGAVRLMAVFRAERIICHVNWLLHGTGPIPNKESKVDVLPVLTPRSHQYQETMLQELALLRDQDPELIQFVHHGNAMLPKFPDGCLVVAQKIDAPAYASLVGQDCLVCTQEEGLLVRRILPGSESDRYHLLPLALLPEHQLFLDVEPVFMAKICQIRAPFFSYQL
jgi:transcriptional regulator with XRE-family HTH domain